MNSVLFAYPQSATFGRVLPKSKIYEQAAPRKTVRDLFVRQVERITWQYKLAPETINLSGSDAVPEIQVFQVALKGEDLKDDVLRCIDTAIPFPILFELADGERSRTVAAYKRPSEADSRKWVVSDYFHGPWCEDTDPRSPLPVALGLERLYGQLLAALLPFPALDGEGLRQRVERVERIRALERELEKAEARLRKEKQFNRKVELNAEVRGLRQEIDSLTRVAADRKGT